MGIVRFSGVGGLNSLGLIFGERPRQTVKFVKSAILTEYAVSIV